MVDGVTVTVMEYGPHFDQNYVVFSRYTVILEANHNVENEEVLIEHILQSKRFFLKNTPSET